MPDWLRSLTEKTHSCLTPEARSYLYSRGFSDSLIEEYQIGFSDPQQVKVIVGTQEFLDWHPRSFWNKLVFPITSPLGDVIGVQVRTLSDAETPIYEDFHCYTKETAPFVPYFFGLKQSARSIFESQRVVLVEGVFDLAAIRSYTQVGLAILTSGVPYASRVFLRRFAKSIRVLTDMDDSGRQAASRLAANSTAHLSIPNYSEKDPGELYKKRKLSELKRISEF